MYKIIFKVKQEINGNITNGIRNPFRLNRENKAMKDKKLGIFAFRLCSISTVWAHRTRHFSDFEKFYKNTPNF